MPVYRIVGDKFVSQEEIVERVAIGQGEEVADLVGIQMGAMVEGERAEFKPVGENKPLLVEIRHVYTGKYPNWSLPLLSKPAMLVTSSFKSLATYKAKSKAINFLKPDISQKDSLQNIKASEQGTPVVFYSPALTQPNNILDIEIIFDKFDPGLLEMLGSAFTAAGGIPLFATYSAYLLAAGVVTKLSGAIAERLIDGSPSFSKSFEVSFDRGGSIVPDKGFHILTGDDFRLDADGYYPDEEAGLIIDSRTNQEYEGEHPYVVISLDGRKHDSYSSFQPTNITADLLAQYYHVQEGQEQPLDMLLEAVKLYNDVEYKRKADYYNSQLKKYQDGTEQYQIFLEKRDAHLENLITDVFK